MKTKTAKKSSAVVLKKHPLLSFFIDVVDEATKGNVVYHLWLGVLTLLMLAGTAAYAIQLDQGLAVTGMTDHVSWGLYISNFTFLVGIAAASVMVVVPAYVFHQYDFLRAVLIGEGIAVAALLMCIAFVIVDMGQPAKLWHMLPIIGYFNLPQSMLAWDVIVLNGYLLLNIFIPFYIIYTRYQGKIPNKKLYLPFIFVSIFWAFSIHLVTAFLYAGLVARPFWNTSVMGPRFLASAFAAGTALIIIVLHAVKKFSVMEIADQIFMKLSLITIVAAQINLIMLGSEFFKEFYYPTEHSESAQFLFFGLDGHHSLNGWMTFSIITGVISVSALMIPKIRNSPSTLLIFCTLLFISIWIEKGIGLIIPGFIPTPLGEVVDYYPTLVEILITIGIWAMGIFVFTVLAKVVIAIETKKISFIAESPKKPPTAAPKASVSAPAKTS